MLRWIAVADAYAAAEAAFENKTFLPQARPVALMRSVLQTGRQGLLLLPIPKTTPGGLGVSATTGDCLRA